MYILGCHFGHDANISLIKDNKIICYFEKERHSRVKHAMGLDSNDIVAILDSYNLTIEDIDVVGITCTQKCPIIDWDNTLKISLRGKKITNLNVIDANQWIENLPKDFPYRLFFKWSNKNAKAGFLFSEHFYKSSLLKQVFSFTKDNNDLCQAQEILFSINNRSPKKAYYVGHHFAHAAYAFGMSSKPNALIITMDGATANGYIGGGGGLLW